MFIRNSCLKKCLFVFSGVKAWCKNFENRVWKNSCIKKCLFVFPGVTRWMSIFLRKGCEKKSYQNCICHPGVKVWSQNFWERGVRKKSYQQIYLLFLGSKFDVRIFEKMAWEKRNFFKKKPLVAKYFLSLPWKICNAIFQHFARFWFK